MDAETPEELKSFQAASVYNESLTTHEPELLLLLMQGTVGNIVTITAVFFNEK